MTVKSKDGYPQPYTRTPKTHVRVPETEPVTDLRSPEMSHGRAGRLVPSARRGGRWGSGRAIEYLDVGEGPVVLAVHGTGSSAGFWRPALAALARDHRVIAPSLPGHGRSDALPSAPVDLLPYADALAGLLDALDVPSAVAVGHSLGGLVCLRLALADPRRVAALVLADSGGAPIGRLRLHAIVGALRGARALAARPVVGRTLTTRPGLRRAVVGRAVHDAERMTPEMLTESLWAFARPGVTDAIVAGAREQGGSAARLVRVPTTVVWGREDRILPVGLGVELAEAVPGAALEVLDRAGHCPMLDRPDLFAEAVRRATRRGAPSEVAQSRARTP